MPSCASASSLSGLLTQPENHSFARPAFRDLGASVVGERHIEGAAVGVNVAKLVFLEHDRSRAPQGELSADGGPSGDLVEDGCGG